MKIIFLDIDGVLIPPRHRPPNTADPDCVKLLNIITDRTKAKIVISSSWRHYGYNKTVSSLRDWGVTGEIIGATGIERECRAQEIMRWLAHNTAKKVERHIVIDDEPGASTSEKSFVQTNGDYGITLTDMDRAIDILNGYSLDL